MSKRFHLKRAATVLAATVLLAGQSCPAAAAPFPDPTRPPARFDSSVAAAPSSVSLRLGSILIAQQRRVAVINGRPMMVGEKINGARLMAIEPGQVILRRGARDIVLDLLSAQTKRPVVHVNEE